MTTINLWDSPRKVSVVVDNDSWVIPYAMNIVNALCQKGDEAVFCRQHDEIKEGVVAFYLGCTRITPDEVLARNKKNLVVHASDLPRGRGFSPLTWKILEGESHIPVCLLEAVSEVDAGAVIYRDTLMFEGHELLDEMRSALGKKTEELCLRFMNEKNIIDGVSQEGEPTFYERRRPEDSYLDYSSSLKEQFNLLRVVDNDKYPAYFIHNGYKYTLKIEKDSRMEE